MWVEFLKSRQGYGYFASDKANLSKDLAEEMINGGWAKNAEQPEESDLPIDLPCRSALIKGGLTTISQVLASKDVLTDVKGVGEKSAAGIINLLEVKE